LFQEREVSKTYLALAVGRPSIEEGSINKPIMEHPVIKGKMVTNAKGKPSLTDYKVVQQWALYSLIELQLHTGRTHQIRVHLQALGNPVVCDDVYGDGKPFLLSNIKKKFKLSKQEEEERPLLNRLALHAYQLQFKKEDGTPINAVAPLPKDMAACINQLNKWSK
ncbi:MAG TPA: RNA pseudouridine synthase, partial [Flavipsychrobacter sp.]|nr:RNA pseudouridine synthase [Flavipsychrobacter sp.]